MPITDFGYFIFQATSNVISFSLTASVSAPAYRPVICDLSNRNRALSISYIAAFILSSFVGVFNEIYSGCLSIYFVAEN